MKKLLFLLLSAAVAVSASAGIKGAKINQSKMAPYSTASKTEQVVRKANGAVVSTPAPAVLRAPSKADIPEGYAMITLTVGDVWGDGSGYQMLLDADATAYGTIIPTTGGLTTSGDASAATYAEFEYKIPENADGALTTSNIVINNTVSIMVPAGVYDFCFTNPTPGDRMWIASENGPVPGRVNDFEFQAGYNYIYTITLNGENDYIELMVPGGENQALTVPEGLTVTPGDTYADVTWNDTDDEIWNLRYRPVVDLSGNPLECHFALDSYEADMEHWYVYDADGDGYNWGLAYSSSSQDDACLYSYSWSSASGALTPDNYLLSEDLPLKGELRFTLWGASNSFPEQLLVYAAVGEEDPVLLTESPLATTTTHTTYTYDLSQFGGEMGYIIFRHTGTTDMYALYLDDIFIGDPNAEVAVPADWIYVNGLTETDYTIEGLTPETDYEVQVQAAGLIGGSAWCDVVEFTTLPLTPDVYILGEVGEKTWDPTDGLKMEYNAEDNIYTATVTFDGRGQSGENYFSFTTELAENNDDGGWTYIAPFRFGAVSEGDFWYDDQYDGQPLDLTYENYQAFRIMGGEYKLTVDLANMKLIIEKQAPEVMIGDVNMDGKVNIADVTALIDYLLSNDASLISLPNSNINGDTNINIADVTALIDMLLTN